MGGLGSGSWYRLEKKATVEESLTVRVSQFRDRLEAFSTGSIRWSWRGGQESSIGYSISPDEESPSVTLFFRWRDREDVRIPIQMQSTAVHFGGRRWWFTCPLAMNNAPCRRRVGALHLPPGAKYFGCRSCHQLTYQSCQTAHQMERFAKAFFQNNDYLER